MNTITIKESTFAKLNTLLYKLSQANPQDAHLYIDDAEDLRNELTLGHEVELRLKYSELSDDAKEKALQHWCETHDGNNWSVENNESLKKFMDDFGITFQGRDGYEYGINHAYITATYPECSDLVGNTYYGGHDGNEPTGARLAKWLYNNFFDKLYEGKYYSKHKNGKHYSRRSKIQFEPAAPTGYCMDCELWGTVTKFIDSPTKGATLKDVLSDALHNWVYACSNDYESQFTEEYFAEHADANDYEFDEDGNWL